ncbi:phospholipase C [Anseongella ginsenosidimutans]|uniref:phospholipase C n=1 Tax=Anseongella ginsenosidimutans TaxID=496056 RepID=A0A4R3KRN6_9SPHI|nr:phospholipase C, phosphocholine-specific [Anseongella ginsenosidimutans]QEC53066.1 phospholipase C, phosphocholine-specific [Anseongella ginsenosidimutans]TCS87682.1 phospholipase C [Anseongella ginsenosidimutans]
MTKLNRRKFITMTTGAGIATALWGPLLQKALAVQAHNASRSINDVKHIVILMQENRSFDHYFGAMKGVRGFGDRFPVPLESGRRAFHQSDGNQVVPPYRAHGKTSNAALVQGTPHNFSDMQAAWNQGKYGFWPLFKTPYSMAYYTREEIPFQYAMAESFTICDAYFCSIATGTDPNRIVFWSGANFDPEKRAAGINCTDADSEPVNLRCWITGALPKPGYTYKGNAFKWPTIPDVLDKEGVSWRIYQDPNDNWTGAMHGCLAFESFREAKPGSSIYENGMRHWTLENLKKDVLNDTLPQVSWVLPSQKDSEHPGAPSSPYRGADFTHEVLEAITSNPEVWSKTVFFLTFDENDGFFDHLPAPAVPSYNLDNTLAGKSTTDLAGMYFDNSKGEHNYLDKRDTISGNLRPWGMGPRVPMYILSPWSKGGWVNSEVADHTSVAQFIEKRFGITIPAITPWHRAVSSDLTSAFDFVTPNDPKFPAMPDTSDHALRDEASKRLPKAVAPNTPSSLYQEKGTRFSRALPYRLHCHCQAKKNENKIKLIFENKGEAGAVYHVYDLYNLDAIPKRYTVEAGKSLDDEWTLPSEGKYDLEVFGPNGYFQKFSGSILMNEPVATIDYDHRKGGISITLQNPGSSPLQLAISANAYDHPGENSFTIDPGKNKKKRWELAGSGNWYDFSVKSADGYLHRFAGRVETGRHSVSDPAMAAEI